MFRDVLQLEMMCKKDFATFLRFEERENLRSAFAEAEKSIPNVAPTRIPNGHGNATAVFDTFTQSVTAEGDPDFGGDASDVQDKLINVVEIVSTARAFAARKADGTIFTWGDNDEFGSVRKLFKEIGQSANKKRKRSDSKFSKLAKRRKRL